MNTKRKEQRIYNKKKVMTVHIGLHLHTYMYNISYMLHIYTYVTLQG